MFHLNVNKTFLVTVLLLLGIREIHCECKHSHITICDNLDDIKDRAGVASWTELIVGNENVNKSALTTYNLHDIIPFKKLISFTIIGQLNQISPLFGRCQFDYDLQLLSFYKNDIKTLGQGSIPDLKLKKLSFVDNNIERVEKFLSPSAKIEILDLSNNKIEAIENDVFVFGDRPLVTKSLIMKNNQISYIQEKSLPKSLKTLNLDGNKLRTIQDEVISNLVHLRELTLSRNHLYIIPNIAKAKKMTYVDLSYNSISNINIGIFRNLTQLYFIDLSNNKIKQASFTDFYFLTRKTEGLLLSLGFNELMSFSFGNITDSFENSAVELFLYGNPFDCTEFNKTQISMNELKIRQNPCDLKFQSEGKTPYCIDYPKIFYLDVSNTVNTFLTVIQKNRRLIPCEIHPANSLTTRNVRCVA